MKYGTTITEHDLGKWGKVKFAQWNHPNEQRKEFTERDVNWLAQFIRPGDTAIDIGAFTGDTALPMAVAAGKDGQVYAFEPNPASFDILVQNSTLNFHIGSIIAHPCAIGLRRGDAVFNYHCERINGGYMADGEPIAVKTVRLDEQAIFGRIPFVKFDCEGEDGLLLSQYDHWLKLRRAVVQVERYPHLTLIQANDLWKAITNYGIPSLKDDWNFTELKELPSTLVDIIIRPHA